VIVADTSALLAFYNRPEPMHDAVSAVIDATQEGLVVSPFVVAELEYLLAMRAGTRAAISALRELGGGAYVIPTIGSSEIDQAATVMERYVDQDIGVTDASLVVLAARYRTRSILTLDHRHFNVLRPLDGGHFFLLPG
jgi:hypothetical protein